jgi:hypothetical protein
MCGGSGKRLRGKLDKLRAATVFGDKLRIIEPRAGGGLTTRLDPIPDSPIELKPSGKQGDTFIRIPLHDDHERDIGVNKVFEMIANSWFQ